MYPAAPHDSPDTLKETPSGGAADPRVEAFREFLAALDRTESVLTPMRRLRRLGFSVCVVSPQPTRMSAQPEAQSVRRGPQGEGPHPDPKPDRPPLLSLEVEGHPAPWLSRGDEGDVEDQAKRHALDDWMTAVARSALAAIGAGNRLHADAALPHTGPVHVDLTFVSPPGHDDPPGSPWVCPVKPNGTKADPSVPDLDGLATATLAALAGIALADVSQVASIAARKVRGPSPGATIAITRA